MRSSTLLLALPALSVAQQVPLVDQVKGWFNKATESLSSVIPSAPSAPSVPSVSIPNPVASGAKKIADLNVQPITLANHDQILKPGAATASPGIETWMIFVTGGNKTCYGRCAHAEKAWHESVALLSASPNPPNLGLLDCEADTVLCHAWAVSPPQVLHFQLPQPLPDQSTPASTVRNIRVNRTTITAPEIAAVHLQETYKEKEPYEGFWHPFDGPLAKFGLNVPVGYVIWGFSMIPSWAFMIVVSMVSRTFMSRRMQPGAGAGGAPAGNQQQQRGSS